MKLPEFTMLEIWSSTSIPLFSISDWFLIKTPKPLHVSNQLHWFDFCSQARVVLLYIMVSEFKVLCYAPVAACFQTGSLVTPFPEVRSQSQRGVYSACSAVINMQMSIPTRGSYCIWSTNISGLEILFFWQSYWLMVHKIHSWKCS